MGFAFKPATRTKTKARIALAGPSGAGKTRWALEVARFLGQRIAVVDTENSSASLYAGLNDLHFDTLNLDNFSIQNYLDAIALAEREKYDVIVIDSLSHAWAGEGGALETVDKLKGNNAFTNGWGAVTPLQNKLTNAITQCSSHIVVTLQSHQEYVLEEQTNRAGKKVQVPVRKGMKPIQRAGMEYIFTVYGELRLEDHAYNVTKSRIHSIKQDYVSVNELDHFAKTVRDFHESGAEMASTEPAAQPSTAAAPQTQPKDAAPPEEPKRRQPDYSKIPKSFEYGGGRWSGTPIAEAPADVLHMLIDDREARMSSLDPNKSDASFVRYACQEAIKHARKALLEVFEETHPAQMKSA